METVGHLRRGRRGGRDPARRAVAAALALAVVLVAVEAAPHQDSTCDRHPAHHACAICVVTHAPGLPASVPVTVVVVRRPVSRLLASPAGIAPTEASLGAITLRSPPRTS